MIISYRAILLVIVVLICPADRETRATSIATRLLPLVTPFSFRADFSSRQNAARLDRRFSAVLVIVDRPRSNREIASVPETNYEGCYRLLDLESAPNLENSIGLPLQITEPILWATAHGCSERTERIVDGPRASFSRSSPCGLPGAGIVA